MPTKAKTKPHKRPKTVTVEYHHKEIGAFREELSKADRDLYSERTISATLRNQLDDANRAIRHSQSQIKSHVETANALRDKITVLENALHALQMVNVVGHLPETDEPRITPTGRNADGPWVTPRTFKNLDELFRELDKRD